MNLPTNFSQVEPYGKNSRLQKNAFFRAWDAFSKEVPQKNLIIYDDEGNKYTLNTQGLVVSTKKQPTP